MVNRPEQTHGNIAFCDWRSWQLAIAASLFSNTSQVQWLSVGLTLAFTAHAVNVCQERL